MGKRAQALLTLFLAVALLPAACAEGTTPATTAALTPTPTPLLISQVPTAVPPEIANRLREEKGTVSLLVRGETGVPGATWVSEGYGTVVGKNKHGLFLATVYHIFVDPTTGQTANFTQVVIQGQLVSAAMVKVYSQPPVDLAIIHLPEPGELADLSVVPLAERQARVGDMLYVAGIGLEVVSVDPYLIQAKLNPNLAAFRTSGIGARNFSGELVGVVMGLQPIKGEVVYHNLIPSRHVRAVLQGAIEKASKK